jgi:hypothetical protein
MILKPPFGRQLNKGHHFANGLVGCWLFNEGSGFTTKDLSGNGNDGVLSSGITWGAGLNGLVVNVDDDWITTGATIPDSGTILVWHSYGWDTEVSAADDFYLFGGTSGDTELAARWQSGQSHVVFYTNADAIGLYNPPATLAGQHCIAITWSDLRGLGYLDGVEVADEQTDHTTGGDDTLVLANKDPAGSDGFLGTIDFCYLYDRVHTASEIAYLYRKPFCMFEVDL